MSYTDGVCALEKTSVTQTGLSSSLTDMSDKLTAMMAHTSLATQFVAHGDQKKF